MSWHKLKVRVYNYVNGRPLGHRLILAWQRLRDGAVRLFAEFRAPFLRDPALRMDMTDGVLRLGLTARCNARCRFCDFWKREHERGLDMPKDYLYKYCLPLYEKIRTLALTDGEAIVSKEFFPFCDFISKNYPRITVSVETNGIGFDRRYQEVAADGLFSVHFSLNAVTEETYVRGVWDRRYPGAASAFRHSRRNFLDYMALLKERGLLAFAPGVSMVINSDTFADVPEFVRFALRNHAAKMTFFFDYSEIDLDDRDFKNPDFTATLRILAEMERVLKDKVLVFYRLFIATDVCRKAEAAADAIPLDELREKYRDLLELAEGRSIVGEWRERQALRAARGKKTYSLHEDYATTLCSGAGETPVCRMPWNELDIRPYEGSPKYRICGWLKTYLPTKRFERGGGFDWEALENSCHSRLIRKRILRGDYSDCMECCPLNPVHHRIVKVLNERNCSDAKGL